MAKVRELFTQWGFKIDDQPLIDLENQLEGVLGAVKVVGTAAVATAGAFFGLATATSVLGKNLNILSKSIGVPTDSLQEFRFMAGQVGLEASTLDGAISSLAQNMAQARFGEGSALAGITILNREVGTAIELTGSLDNQFSQIVEGLGKVDNVNTRGLIAEKFFGGSAREMMVLFDQGTEGVAKMRAEFKRLGGGISQNGIKLSKEFTQSMASLWTVISGIANAIGEHIMPAFREWIDVLAEFILENRELIKSGINAFFDVFAAIVGTAITLVTGLVKAIKAINKPFNWMVKLLKLISIYLIGIVAMKIYALLGLAATAAWTFVGSLFGVNLALLKTNILLGGIPLLIGAILVGLALIAEDLYVWSQGGNSVFGLLIEGANKIGNRVNSWIDKIKNKMIRGLIRGVINGAKEVMLNLIPGVSLLMKAIKIVQAWRAKNKQKGGASGGWEEDDVPDIGKGMDAVDKTRGPMIGLGGGYNADASSVTKTVTINSNIDVTGVAPEQAQEAAKDAFKDIFKLNLREADRDAAPSVDY